MSKRVYDAVDFKEFAELQRQLEADVKECDAHWAKESSCVGCPHHRPSITYCTRSRPYSEW